MRRHALSAATAGLAALLLLAGCGTATDDDTGEADQPAAEQSGDGQGGDDQPAASAEEDAAALAAVELDGEPGEQPAVDFDAPLSVGAPAARVVSPGDGEELTASHNAHLHIVVLDGDDGTVVSSTYGDATENVFLGDDTIAEELLDSLVGEQVGARALFAAPDPSGITTLMALEVVDASEVLERAEGTAVEPEADLPAITLDEDGAPGMAPVDSPAPDELVVQPLIEGEGEEVSEGESVVVEYSGWLWDGEAFDSSWERGAPFTFPLGQGAVIEGWDEGVQGQRVGSQLLLVVPPEKGYGDADQAEIPGGSTLVFVVDVLGVA